MNETTIGALLMPSPCTRSSTPRRPAGKRPAAPARKLAIALVLVAFAAGCGREMREDPILRLSAAESLVQGKDLMQREKYGAARRYLLHSFEVEPNSAQGREALLLAADCFFEDGGSQNWIQAEAKYRDFQNRFPTSDRSAYVQFQIGRSLAQRMEKPDRDQSTATKALQAFEDLVRLYPTSEYAVRAEQEIDGVRNNLAAHEMQVGFFYLRYGLPLAAVERFKIVLEDFPEYDQPDRALFHLGLAYERMAKVEEAVGAFSRLRAEFPDSRWVSKIPQLLAPAPAPPPTAAAKPAEVGG